MAVPASYQASHVASESDDPSDRTDAVSTTTTTSTGGHGNGFGAIASVLLAFCAGTVVGAFMNHANSRRRAAENAGYDSELTELR